MDTGLMNIMRSKVLSALEKTQKHLDSLERYCPVDHTAVEPLRLELMTIYSKVLALKEVK